MATPSLGMPEIERSSLASAAPHVPASGVFAAVVIVTLAMVLLAPDVQADSDGGVPALEIDHGWPVGTIQQQLDQDATTVPFGKGAVFVPAMTNPLDEPPVSVRQGDVVIAEGTTGRRIVVLPGDYTVAMGTGAVEQRFRIDVTVRELQVSVVPVTWAGLAVHVVDDALNSARESYEVIRVDSREYIDVGFGADEQAGEPVTTWILRPGLYKIVRVGETYRARRDFATVRLVGSRLTDFLLVVDQTTGDFKGAGEVPREELFLAGKGNLWWSFIFGGDVNMSSRQNVLGVEDGESFSFRAFLDTKLSAKVFDNPLILQLQIEEGGQVAGSLFPRDNPQNVASIPWRKTHDRADIDGLYVYRLFPWLGPYLRFGVETNLIEEVGDFDYLARTDQLRETTKVRVYDSDNVFRRDRAPSDRVRVLPSLGITSIKEGLGINYRVFKAVFGETSIRAGLGARHQIARSVIQPADVPRIDCANAAPSAVTLPDGTVATPAEVCTPGQEQFVEFYQRVPTTNQVGIEATVLATLRLTRWVLVNVEVDTLVPFGDFSDIVVDIESTLALKLTSFASVNYVFRYLRNPSLSATDETLDRFEHDLLLRFSVELP